MKNYYFYKFDLCLNHFVDCEIDGRIVLRFRVAKIHEIKHVRPHVVLLRHMCLEPLKDKSFRNLFINSIYYSYSHYNAQIKIAIIIVFYAIKIQYILHYIGVMFEII